jgi:hypothetical protein
MALAALLLVGLAGCARNTPLAPGAPTRPDPEVIRQQARDALARWDAAVAKANGPKMFVPIGELTNQVGEWEDGKGDNNKAALDAGLVVTRAPLPATPTDSADIRWDNGTSLRIRPISAADALRHITEGAMSTCASCAPLEVMSARLTTVRMSTTKGDAAVPAWEFTLIGSRVRITRVAVDSSATVTVSPPPWDATNPPDGLSIEAATVSADGRRLTVRFVGAPGTAAVPCGVDYTTETVESGSAVVVILVEHFYTGDPKGIDGCADVGADRTATADLDQPLGDRAVLEVREGRPVPVTVAKP